MGSRMIVADTNLVAYSVIPGPHEGEVERVRAADHDWIAPQLLRSELLNVLVRYIAEGRIDRDMGLKTFRRGMSLVKLLDRPTEAIGIFNLCQSAGCSSYDAEFVWLARELGVPLITADQQVLDAFPETAISFSVFIESRR